MIRFAVVSLAKIMIELFFGSCLPMLRLAPLADVTVGLLSVGAIFCWRLFDSTAHLDLSIYCDWIFYLS